MSGNRSGRPRGYAGVAEKILRETRDGAELVEFALEVWRDPERPWTERVAMHQWLSDRGLGKAIAQHELHVSTGDGEGDDVSLEHLSTEELRQALRERDEWAAKWLTHGSVNRELPSTTSDGTHDPGHTDA